MPRILLGSPKPNPHGDNYFGPERTERESLEWDRACLSGTVRVAPVALEGEVEAEPEPVR